MALGGTDLNLLLPLKVLLEPTTGVPLSVAAAVTAWLVVTGLELLPGALTAYRKPTG